MIFRHRLSFLLCLLFLFAISATVSNAQTRPRIATTTESRPVNLPNTIEKIKRTVLSSPVTAVVQRPTMTNDIIVVGQNKPIQKPLVEKTALVKSSYSDVNAASLLSYTSPTDQKLLNSIQSKIGIPYRLGTQGPTRYDCSGFVWSVFRDAGIFFDRTSARVLWNEFEPVSGDERFKFGTLVFFNKLGHIGIVADENGFYQASSSKGITYSPFKGYWENRIVGYRRIPANYIAKR